MNFTDLKGRTLTAVSVNDDKDEVIFALDSGDRYKLYHSQDCCESVNVDDIVGDLADLVGSPILQADAARRQPRLEGESLNARDSDFLNGKHSAARDIGLVFGVPPQILGIPGDATFANYEQASLSFWTDTVLPKLAFILDEVTVG